MQQIFFRYQRNLHYLLGLLSLCIMAISIWIRNEVSLAKLLSLLVISTLLLAVCVTCLVIHGKYHRYEKYCKRIRSEYHKILKSQSYKLERLTLQEYQVLLYILDGYPQEKIMKRLRLNYSGIYQYIKVIGGKLEISMKEYLFDIDWQRALC